MQSDSYVQILTSFHNHISGELPYTLENFEKIDKMVSTLHEMALVEQGAAHSIISYGEKLPLVSGSWDLSTGFWWNDLKHFMNRSRGIADWRETFADGSLAKGPSIHDVCKVRGVGAEELTNFVDKEYQNVAWNLSKGGWGSKLPEKIADFIYGLS